MGTRVAGSLNVIVSGRVPNVNQSITITYIYIYIYIYIYSTPFSAPLLKLKAADQPQHISYYYHAQYIISTRAFVLYLHTVRRYLSIYQSFNLDRSGSSDQPLTSTSSKFQSLRSLRIYAFFPCTKQMTSAGRSRLLPRLT